MCPLNSPGTPSHCCPHRAFLPRHQWSWWSWMETSACPLLKGGCPEARPWGVRGRLGLAPVTTRASSPPTPRVSGTGDQAERVLPSASASVQNSPVSSAQWGSWPVGLVAATVTAKEQHSDSGSSALPPRGGLEPTEPLLLPTPPTRGSAALAARCLSNSQTKTPSRSGYEPARPGGSVAGSVGQKRRAAPPGSCARFCSVTGVADVASVAPVLLASGGARDSLCPQSFLFLLRRPTHLKRHPGLRRQVGDALRGGPASWGQTLLS
ncbi:class E basic helix-loop-helix protein 23 isoform X1 [Phacochoerus africanus]|uniref:class E basic helix-loop-helix protein 23 isoform X1 n=1 Tax=Phacochoerus africanus TaxID=41426 RepID=UPI001FD9FBDA|nr:class E basic helix-loop-helix protein 23 isoform X1 [Phacochoerus africanus]